MPESNINKGDFIINITEIILDNISNDQFGVSELARETGMSRSNLLRKIKKLTNKSVSQFIREVRLKQAMEILRQGSLNITEVSYRVGFNSPSYFIKCFRDFYGYPPGEADNLKNSKDKPANTGDSGKKHRIVILIATLIAIIFTAVLFVIFNPFSKHEINFEKSIAVLPFKNDSNDSTNVYLINGLMESVLTNLQKIENLRVISRTSVEKYRNNHKTAPEIAEELDIKYLVEGSGQKIGNQIKLNIQLIAAWNDKHLWAGQYTREATDIFNLQKEVAKDIADKIKVIITPEEAKRINKSPTHNVIAYDYFLKGLNFLNNPGYPNAESAIPLFEKALVHDPEFAHAYAAIARAYYYLDDSRNEKKYSNKIKINAENALLFDPQLPQSLIAKALYFMHINEYKLAIPYLEKSLEYNPNYNLPLIFLVDIYVNHLPDTKKYLEYTLQGVKIDIASYDSTTTSIIYLHLSNAFIQSGFITEAEKYINLSIEYDSENLYSEYVKAYIDYARNRDLAQLKDKLISSLKKDTNRIDILQEIGKTYYFMRDYNNSYHYYNKFIKIKKALNLDIYQSENAKIGTMLSKMGLSEESEKVFKIFEEYAKNDLSIYKHINLAMFYSHTGDTQKAIKHMRLFSEQDHFHYWTVIFLKIDPMVENIKNLPEFKEIFNKIETKFWNYHEDLKSTLVEKELL